MAVTEKIKNAAGRLAHAYIVTSPSEDAGFENAKDLAQMMVCSAQEPPCGVCRDCVKAHKGIHPDIAVITRETDDKGKAKREISVGQIRNMIADAHIIPNEAARKVYILRDGGCMNAAAQNAMLKVLEEPPAHACFIICTENASLLLDTVRSRCVELKVRSEEQQADEGIQQDAVRYLEKAFNGDRAGLLLLCSELSAMDNTSALSFVTQVRRQLIENLGSLLDRDRRKQFSLIELMDRSEKYLRLNVSVKHVFGLISVKTLD